MRSDSSNGAHSKAAMLRKSQDIFNASCWAGISYDAAYIGIYRRNLLFALLTYKVTLCGLLWNSIELPAALIRYIRNRWSGTRQGVASGIRPLSIAIAR
jgi:hypothetical protein